jgi:hypothetical protein
MYLLVTKLQALPQLFCLLCVSDSGLMDDSGVSCSHILLPHDLLAMVDCGLQFLHLLFVHPFALDHFLLQ